MTEADSVFKITTQDELILLGILREYVLELQTRGDAFLFSEEQWTEVWKRLTAKATHIMSRPSAPTILVIMAINKFKEDNDFPRLPCSVKACSCTAYHETTLGNCYCKHQKRYHNQLSPLEQEQLPRILEYIHQYTRPWSKAETIKLFNVGENFDPRSFNRSRNGCIHHWTEVVSVIFKQKDKSIEVSIEDLIDEFHDSGNIEEPAESVTFSRTEAKNMTIQYLRDKKAINAGLNDRLLNECEGYFIKLLGWIAKKRGQSLKRLCTDAITTYYKQAELGVQEEQSEN